MPRISPDLLRRFVTAVIEALGTSSQKARLVCDHLVEANLTGHDSHGVIRLMQYCNDLKAGLVRPDAEPRILRRGASTALIDGGQGWGAPAARFAMDLAIEMAETHTLSAVSVRSCHHIGRVGVFPALAAERGLIGMGYCNVEGQARVAPWGGTERRLPTNPIAIAVPAEGDPIVVDFATCAVSEGKVRLYKTEGKQVPAGWVLDEKGNFSTDPNDAYEDGAIAPLGGDQGHKGYGLAVAIDLLGGILAGATSAAMEGRYGNNFLFQVIDPSAFGDPSDFRRGIADYVHYVTSARRREGVKQILMPGQIELIRRAENLKHGLRIEPEVWNQLKELGRSMGIELEGD